MRAGYSIFLLILSLTVCNAVEKIVREIIQIHTRNNPSLGAQLIRMQFHDCFVRGCDASVLLDTVNNSKAEKEAIPNQSLGGFDVIDDIKAAIERVCPKVVSCADILALAARDAISAPFKKSMWSVQLGRRDGRVSLATEINGNLPSPFANFTSAHTLGDSCCGAFSRRLYNFTSKGDADPSLDPTYAKILRKQCPNPASPAITVEMDPGSSLSFDNHYYDILLQKKGLFVSDAALLTDKNSNKIVTRLQRSRSLFFTAFAKSMKKMAAIGVLTGNAGEIRQNCRVVNPGKN
ncbi:hypothetical protein CXB51_025644 [Gossypium anomalum]|uniref:Peroxidase n=1 Tax=Gossypium anomalum TaxID=47600 RepID=A0A8J6CQJ5_9ROSI|nr:hypothetical protein CXB51_025644 [Gossypium anomalum]